MSDTTMPAWLDLALGFLREKRPESCTRLCALLCCLNGCITAEATLVFAFLHPGAAPSVVALVGVTSALIAAGCVALLTRTRNIPSAQENSSAS